jgi:hypothetical protein
MTTTPDTTPEATVAADPIRDLKHDLLHSVISSIVTMTRGRDDYETAQRADLARVAYHAAALLATLAGLDPERAILTIEASNDALDGGDAIHLAWEAALGEGHDPQVWVDDARQRAPRLGGGE